jgi:fatty acid synthase
VTVGSEDKKEYLLKTFPQLHPEDIGDSRSTSFERMVMQQTGGRGVDYVFNSLDQDKLQVGQP